MGLNTSRILSQICSSCSLSSEATFLIWPTCWILSQPQPVNVLISPKFFSLSLCTIHVILPLAFFCLCFFNGTGFSLAMMKFHLEDQCPQNTSEKYFIILCQHELLQTVNGNGISIYKFDQMSFGYKVQHVINFSHFYFLLILCLLLTCDPDMKPKSVN